MTAPLPRPQHGGSILPLRDLLNVTPETFEVITGWMTAALIFDAPHPIGLLGGQQGSGQQYRAKAGCVLGGDSGSHVTYSKTNGFISADTSVPLAGLSSRQDAS